MTLSLSTSMTLVCQFDWEACSQSNAWLLPEEPQTANQLSEPQMSPPLRLMSSQSVSQSEPEHRLAQQRPKRHRISINAHVHMFICILCQSLCIKGSIQFFSSLPWNNIHMLTCTLKHFLLDVIIPQILRCYSCCAISQKRTKLFFFFILVETLSI